MKELCEMTELDHIKMLCEFIFQHKDQIGGSFSTLTDKNQVFGFVYHYFEEDDNDKKKIGVEISVENILKAVKADFNRYGYARRFDKTATKKKIVSALKSTTKEKRLYAYQIIFAFRLYLRECRSKETEPQFVKLASSFMTNMVYDYAEMINGEFEQLMENTYGENWRKVKFVYV